MARFLDRIVFCMFAEDIGLLPAKLFTELLQKSRGTPAKFVRYIGLLFEAMRDGGDFLLRDIKRFNGNLFADVDVLDLDEAETELLFQAAKLEWGAVDASIFGTLFERGLDPSKRSQLGAHYTSRADIETLVEPVVMVPLRREWEKARDSAEAVLDKGDTRKAREKAASAVSDFLGHLGSVKVLDPACGSGNFLFVTLQKMKDLEKEAIVWATDHGLQPPLPMVHPRQFYGIEVNPYAFDLAQMTLWIGYLQWIRDNGFGVQADPILESLADNFRCMDAILDMGPPASSVILSPLRGGASEESSVESSAPRSFEGVAPKRPQDDGGDAENQISPRPSLCQRGGEETPPLEKGGGAERRGDLPFPREPEWPEVDFIVGNPPFLGDKMMRRELGDEYVDALRKLYAGRIPGQSDLCCYWFEKARAYIEAGRCKRAGLLATQGIRGGANREVLRRIKETGDIFFAESDRAWILDGANVHVSMVGFDGGRQKRRLLDGKPVGTINANLTSAVDITYAKRIRDTKQASFIGTTKKAPFDIPYDLAVEMLASPNAHMRPNSDVLVPYLNANDVTSRGREWFIIDFQSKSLEEAAMYELPFEFVKKHVLPLRLNHREAVQQKSWWRMARPCPEMKEATARIQKYIVTPAVSKHRLFVWERFPVQPDHALYVFARSDDYFFGVLHSRLHEVWALKLGTRLETRPRYTPTTCFETFPFPWPPGKELQDDPKVKAIAEAAAELDHLRSNWLNPPEWVKEEVLEFPGSTDGPWARFIDPSTLPDAVILSPLRSETREESGGIGETRSFEGTATKPPQDDGRETAGVPNDPSSFILHPSSSPGAPAPPAIGTVRYPRLVPKDEGCASLLKKRTLTNLYNQRPAWLDLAHRKLDEAVATAYGWPTDLTDEQILERLLALNLERAGPSR